MALISHNFLHHHGSQVLLGKSCLSCFAQVQNHFQLFSILPRCLLHTGLITRANSLRSGAVSILWQPCICLTVNIIVQMSQNLSLLLPQ